VIQYVLLVFSSVIRSAWLKIASIQYNYTIHVHVMYINCSGMFIYSPAVLYMDVLYIAFTRCRKRLVDVAAAKERQR
jgi:hypothetical protein